MRRRTFLWLTIATTLDASFSLPSLAQANLDASNPSAAIAKLKPGQYLWAPAIAPSGPMLVIISLSRQLAFVYRNGVLIGVTTVSTGTKGHETPTGVFTVLQKKVTHHSNLYDSAPMPYMQRLTWDGVAMHAGNLPGYPASHGCVRLPKAFAKLLYGTTKLGMTVVITDSETVPRIAPTPDLLQSHQESAAPSRAPSGNPKSRPPAPSRSSSAPQTSASSSSATASSSAQPPSRSTAPSPKPPPTASPKSTPTASTGCSSHSPARPGREPAHSPPQTAPASASPQDFRAALDEVLSPGVTLVVTTDSLKAGDTGRAPHRPRSRPVELRR